MGIGLRADRRADAAATAEAEGRWPEVSCNEAFGGEGGGMVGCEGFCICSVVSDSRFNLVSSPPPAKFGIRGTMSDGGTAMPFPALIHKV